MYLRLGELAKKALDDNQDLPEYVDLPQEAIDRYFQTWLTWRAFEGKHLPRAGGFEDQPDTMMQVILTLDSLFEKVIRQVKPQVAGDNPAT